MNLTLKVWRQASAGEKGSFEIIEARDISHHMSFLEMLDVINEQRETAGEEPIAFDHDCREGICGTCGAMIGGIAHGPEPGTTLCQLHMRHFKDGDTIVIEPWRSKAFPVVKDLIVDRSAFDRIIQAGGFISAHTGGAPDANAIPIPKEDADLAFDAAACIGCAACVASCKNASAMLFVSAKINHLGRLPQGQVERMERAQNMVRQMDLEGFGNCTNQGECEAVCPKEIKMTNIARMNWDYLRSSLFSRVGAR